MSQSVGSVLSDDDSNLIKTNQLGIPLSVHRIKPEVIRFFRRGCQLILLLDILVVVVVCFASIVFWNQLQKYHPFVLVLIVGLWILIIGLYSFYIDVSRFQSERIIVCERGLLRVRKRFKKNHVEVVHWEDVVEIGKRLTLSLAAALFKKKMDFSHQNYVLVLMQGTPLILDSQYQDTDEMMTMIRQHSGKR